MLNRTMLVSAVAAAVAMVAIAVTFVARTHTTEQFRQQSYMNCVQIQELKHAIVGVLVDSEVGSPKTAADYFARQIARFPIQKCTKP